jgi:hypothetical protein
MRMAWLGCLALGCGGETVVDDIADADADTDVDSDSDGDCCDEWQTILDDGDEDTTDLGAALFAVNGPQADDLYFAGGTLGIEPRAGLGLHFDGNAWEHLAIDVPQTLWWVTLTPEGTAWFAGEEGTVVEYRDGAATIHDTPADAVLFGIWGTSDTDLWAVGGDVSESEAIIEHFDGETWTIFPPPDGITGQLFKVWGPRADDVFIVGYRGTILHWDGGEWTQMESPTTQQLFTVHGRSHEDVWAVGIGPTIVHFDGTSWTSYLDDMGNDPSGATLYAGFLSGVYAPPDGGNVCVSGGGGVKVWIPDMLSGHIEDTLEGGGGDFHGVWCDACGNGFAVGGNFMSPEPSSRHGAIDHHGCEVPTVGLVN